MARSPLQRNAKQCGSVKTKTGEPCRWILPCPYHKTDGSKKPFKGNGVKKNRDINRHEIFIQARLMGKSVVEAGREAGYSENTLKGKIFQIVDSPSYKARIEEHIKMAAIQTEEIIGGVVSESRMDIADLFPDDEMLQRAKAMGISHNIRKLKRRPIFAGFDPKGTPIWNYELEVEVYSAHEARKVLIKVFGLKDLPAPKRNAQVKFEAAIELIMRQAEEAELKTTREEVAEMLKKLPQFKILFDKEQ